ncbi:transcriptional regulator, TrmB [Haladaptatus paucihalophilus DX253]|uniref:Sugar-specific transcriptional regulator TrmB n=1 Tax=Haladaptatus paucihalophilus DX253 TaxID=797209 RepID=E7QMQ1_HALPU|nr:TrmB family transcriptional regulator sugar-binding domain-containing protein [Haladaptatus paucihalophilus]EFW94235.1 transcriptional regulator, TrmB [Haladaptatus paucihalophilus DX253]SHL34613.1 Sugar-specific transcriptional regulator TrmB [Haladaptatus paucihalophilus DX253]
MTRTNDIDLTKKLTTFGFSEKEIDAYLALLSHGEATVSTLSEDADVSQQGVYNITERLENRGLVQVNSHASPTTIRAVPPATAMAKLSAEIESITPTLEKRFTESQRQDPEVQMIKSRKTILKRTKNAISQAQNEVILAIPESLYPEVESELKDAIDREAFVLLLISGMNALDEDVRQFEGSADVIHYWEESVPFLYTVDDQTALIGKADVVSSEQTDDDAVEVSRSMLTGTVLGTYLGTFWPASTEVFVRDPYPLPRTFDWFRQAVLHAALHMKEGTDLWADIEVENGTMISGPISDIRQGLVTPLSNEFSLETSIVVETDEGEVSVGGPTAFIEDYEAQFVTFRENS